MNQVEVNDSINYVDSQCRNIILYSKDTKLDLVSIQMLYKGILSECEYAVSRLQKQIDKDRDSKEKR